MNLYPKLLAISSFTYWGLLNLKNHCLIFGGWRKSDRSMAMREVVGVIRGWRGFPVVFIFLKYSAYVFFVVRLLFAWVDYKFNFVKSRYKISATRGLDVSLERHWVRCFMDIFQD